MVGVLLRLRVRIERPVHERALIDCLDVRRSEFLLQLRGETILGGGVKLKIGNAAVRIAHRLTVHAANQTDQRPRRWKELKNVVALLRPEGGSALSGIASLTQM